MQSRRERSASNWWHITNQPVTLGKNSTPSGSMVPITMSFDAPRLPAPCINTVTTEFIHGITPSYQPLPCQTTRRYSLIWSSQWGLLFRSSHSQSTSGPEVVLATVQGSLTHQGPRVCRLSVTYWISLVTYRCGRGLRRWLKHTVRKPLSLCSQLTIEPSQLRVGHCVLQHVWNRHDSSKLQRNCGGFNGQEVSDLLGQGNYRIPDSFGKRLISPGILLITALFTDA